MKKNVGILGIFGLLLAIVLITAVLEPSFISAYNIQNTIRWTSLFGIISIGAAFVIMTGGIDLSAGSVVGLVGVLLPMILLDLTASLPIGLAITLSLGAVLVVSLLIGLLHGVLITKVRLQPFVVTLCGLLFYRGFARWVTGGIRRKGLAMDLMDSGKLLLGVFLSQILLAYRCRLSCWL